MPSVHSDYLPILIVALFVLEQRRRRAWMILPTFRFWELVARLDRPVVLLTLRGWFRKRPCYLLPYHGMVFYTWTRPEQLPTGTSLVPLYETPE